jgi:hypothetical protein
MVSFRGSVAGMLLAMAVVPTAAQAAYTFDSAVTVDRNDVGLNFIVDFAGRANGASTSKLSALGNFTYTGATNGGKTYNFNYTLTNDSVYDSRIRSFGFDTSTAAAAVNGLTGFTYEYQDVAFIEGVGEMDVCFAAGSGCTQHASGGINDGSSMNGSFSLTFANVMQSVDLNHFALKFLSVNPKVNGQDWGAGVGSLVSITHGSSPITAPEPETWAMMLMGFGLVGFALRGRRQRHMIAPQAL